VRKTKPLSLLPPAFETWFAERGWEPRTHQLAMIDKARHHRDALLIAPTGAGKTLAGFLPSLVNLAERPKRAKRLHTLYVSPLKALAVDVSRNLERPIAEMNLDITHETRTGDTPAARRQRQRINPPDILLTTPEQVALLLASREAQLLFADLQRVIFDEVHALAPNKRGDLLALDLARLRTIAPHVSVAGLSATVADPESLQAWLSCCGSGRPQADILRFSGGPPPKITIHEHSLNRLPWSGHTARWAYDGVYDAIKSHRMTLVFVNTRSQAEMVFQGLWELNEDSLAIALHHGSLDVGQRRRVEAAMAAGRLQAVVATSTLDLGIDWGDIDLVIHIGAPKGASRLAQRIGRANHRLDEPSKALLVPANRFEVLECRAAVEAVAAGLQDAATAREGGLDVLAQHIWGVACGGPFHPDDLYKEVRTAAPYAALPRQDFDRLVDFVATGGYALKSYERFARLKALPDGRLRLTHPRLAQLYRLNVGTIIESDTIKVRLVGRLARRAKASTSVARGGRVLGNIEEYFIEQLVAGDTFVFAGEILRFEAMAAGEALVTRSASPDAKIPTYAGGRFPLSTSLAAGVRKLVADPGTWSALPEPVQEWLGLQRDKSVLPGQDDLLVEIFPRQSRHYLVCYPFEGRLAHQTLGVLLTRRLVRAGARPLGFAASDYALAIWMLGDVGDKLSSGRLSLSTLFDQDMLGDDLDAWLDESRVMRRTFHHCAMISGLVERRHIGEEKTGRQMSISTGLIYDVLRSHQPDHILLKAARADAATGLLDIRRLGDMLARVRERIVLKILPQVSPLAVPILLDIGRESVAGVSAADVLGQAAARLVEDATR